MQTEKTEYEFSVNGADYSVGQIHYGTFTGLWVWQGEGDESEVFATAAEAQQDALRHATAEDDQDDEDWVPRANPFRAIHTVNSRIED